MNAAATAEPASSELALERDSSREDRAARGGRLRNGWIGIDVGEQSINVVQVRSDDAGFQFRVAESVDSRGVLPDTPGNFRGLAGAIRMIAKSADLQGSRCACLLPRAAYLVDCFDVPDHGPAIRRGEVVDQFCQRNSVGDDEFLIDFTPIPVAAGQNSESRPVHAVGLPRHLVEGFAVEIGRLGWTIESVESPVTVAARCSRMASPLQTEKTVAVVNWEFASASLTLVTRGIACFHRSFRDGGYGSCVKLIAAKFGISPRDAELLLTTYGLPDLAQSTPHLRISTTLLGLLREPLRKFRDELERTIAYTRRKPDVAAPERLLLTGGGGAIPRVGTWLADDVGLPADRWKIEPAARIARAAMPRFADAAALSALRFEEDDQ